jgi:hypothetical protein
LRNLKRNGAKLRLDTEISEVVQEKKKRKTAGVKKVPKIMSKADLDRITEEYNFDFALHPDIMSDASKLNHYNKPYVLAAYRNRNTLALYIDFEDAMLQAKKDTEKLGAILMAMDLANKGTLRNAIDKCRVLGGVSKGSNYFLESNSKAADLIKLITGSGDPFDIHPQTDMEIARRLECSEQIFCDNDSGKQITENCVSGEMKKLVVEKYSAWIEVSPKLHCTFSFPPASKPLSLNKAMKILNDVLGVLSGACYMRGEIGRAHV